METAKNVPKTNKLFLTKGFVKHLYVMVLFRLMGHARNVLISKTSIKLVKSVNKALVTNNKSF